MPLIKKNPENLPKFNLTLTLIFTLVMVGCSGEKNHQTLPTPGNWQSGGDIFIGETDDLIFLIDDCIQDEERIDQVKRLVLPIQRVYELVTDRLEANIIGEEKTTVVFSCQEATLFPLNGQSRWDETQPTITIFSFKGISRDQVLYVSAHELAHLIQWAYNGEGTVDPILVEGWATLAAEPYLIDWIGVQSIDQQVQTYIKKNQYLKINKPGLWDQIYTQAGCSSVRQSIYIEWASFVGYLIKTYGVERLMELMTISSSSNRLARNPEQNIGTGEYETVFGKSLRELEGDWLLSLTSGQ